MALNFPGPYQVRIFYTTTVSSVAIQHVQSLNLDIAVAPDPGDDFVDITPVFRPGVTPDTLDLTIDTWVNSMKSVLSSGGGNTIDRAELWKYEPLSFDSSFVTVYPINVAGTSGSAIVAGGQDIVTMRTTLGGLFKLSFMETVNIAGGVDPGTFASAGVEALVLGIEDGSYPWIGRDGGYPFARIARYPGINEALWKRRFRNQ